MIKPNNCIEGLIPYVPGKPVEELERELGVKGAVKIASNENPLGPSPLAMKAVERELAGLNRYPEGDSFYLKRALAEALGVKPENLIFGNGSNEVLELVARTFLTEGDEAIMGEYAFIVFPIVTQAVGARRVTSPMPGLTHDLQDMYSRITPRTRVIFIANPNNPTATMVGREELEWFLEKVCDDIMIVVDEAYFEYVDDPDYLDTTSQLGRRRSLITTRTFSKIHGLAGLRVGYGIGDAEVISYMNRVREPFNINSLAQAGALAALEDTEHMEKSRRVNALGLEYLTAELQSLKLNVTDSRTNFVLVEFGRDPMPIYDALLREGVIVRPVGGYGLKTHLRVTVGTQAENERFVAALRNVMGK
ncbi:MAG: histidinol-phosphate transaminase [Thermodesulfobacteriota bacterium]